MHLSHVNVSLSFSLSPAVFPPLPSSLSRTQWRGYTQERINTQTKIVPIRIVVRFEWGLMSKVLRILGHIVTMQYS